MCLLLFSAQVSSHIPVQFQAGYHVEWFQELTQQGQTRFSLWCPSRYVWNILNLSWKQLNKCWTEQSNLLTENIIHLQKCMYIDTDQCFFNNSCLLKNKHNQLLLEKNMYLQILPNESWVLLLFQSVQSNIKRPAQLVISFHPLHLQ